MSQSGNIELTANMEYRSKLFWKFEGAAFVDAGNIWNIKDYDFQPEGTFHLDEFYKQIDLFVLSSISEGLPNVLCESISYGIPCIGTDVGGVTSIIDGIYKVVPALIDHLSR